MLFGSGGRSARPWRGGIVCTLALIALAGASSVAGEEEAPKTGWFDQAELSLVATEGNSQSETFSLRNTLRRVWQGAELKLTAGGLRAESTTTSRSAVGTSAADARLVESSTTAVSAERYDLEARYDRQISERLFWYASAGWERNEPAGIRNRAALAAGVGNLWLEREAVRWRTDYGLTYTDQDDVVELPGSGGGFAGVRLASDYWRQLTATTAFTSLLTIDQNLDSSDDLRAALVNTLSVQMSESLALKLSHELRFDNAPSLIAVPVVSSEGVPVGEDLVVEADDIDATLSLALVVGF